MAPSSSLIKQTARRESSQDWLVHKSRDDCTWEILENIWVVNMQVRYTYYNIPVKFANNMFVLDRINNI